MNKLQTLFALIPSLIFCLRYLPFRQAIKIPIIIYKFNVFTVVGNGRIIIDSENVYFGMIRLGLFITNLYPNRSVRLYNKGTIKFKGSAAIGANSAISVLRPNSYLEFGNGFSNSSTLRISCDYRIIFKDWVRFGFDSTVMDSSLHKLKDMDGNFINRGYDEVYLDNNVWIASQCTIMSGTRLPAYAIVAAKSLCNKDYSQQPTHSLYAGSPAKLIKIGIWRDLDDDKIEIEG